MTITALTTLAFMAAMLVLFAALSWRERHTTRRQVARACHEVRGPLSAVALALHGAARRAEIAPTVLAGLELELRRAALALDDLQRRRSEACEEVDLQALLTVQAATWREVARARGADVVVQSEGEALLVRGDAVRLAQALGNVLANAIEHGGGTVVVRSRPLNGCVRIEINDDGQGLPAPVADLVRRQARVGRRGHGLAIASRIAGCHGGRLFALPSLRGACLALELPAVARHPAAREDRLEPPLSSAAAAATGIAARASIPRLPMTSGATS